MRFRQQLDLDYPIARPFAELFCKDCKLHVMTEMETIPTLSQYQLDWVDSENPSECSGFHLSEINMNCYPIIGPQLLITDAVIYNDANEIAILTTRTLERGIYSGPFTSHLPHYYCVF